MATTMPQRQYKNSLRLASILEILAGVWLIIAPFILNFSNISSALWNSIILGIVVAFLAGSRSTDEGNMVSWPSWVNLVLGVWLILSPFILGFSDINQAYWNTMIFGLIIAILSIWSLVATPKTNE